MQKRILEISKKIQAGYLARAEFIRSLGRHQTDIYRLFQGSEEGCPGIVVDRYGDVAILTLLEGIAPELSHEGVIELATTISRSAGVGSVYLKTYPRDRSGMAAARSMSDSVPLVGSAVGRQISACENGHRFLIRPYDGYATGLFIDQRNARKWVAEQVRAGRLLNLFAYTCGFSVYAATAGASTTNVDVSARYLEWGRTNFRLNDLALGSHRFIRRDVRQFVRYAVRHDERFDVVVVDAPTFGRSAAGVFRVSSDLFGLAVDACELLEPGGVLYLSANISTSKIPRFELSGMEPIATGLPEMPRDFISVCAVPWFSCWRKPE